MLGKCPKCFLPFKTKELERLVSGSSARCYACNKLYINSPFWIYIKFYGMLFLTLGVPLFGIRPLTIASCSLGILLAISFQKIQAYMPLTEEV
jgi:phage FluMu protein Com